MQWIKCLDWDESTQPQAQSKMDECLQCFGY